MKRMYNSPQSDIVLLSVTSILSEVSVGEDLSNVTGDAPARRSYSPQVPH